MQISLLICSRNKQWHAIAMNVFFPSVLLSAVKCAAKHRCFMPIGRKGFKWGWCWWDGSTMDAFAEIAKDTALDNRCFPQVLLPPFFSSIAIKCGRNGNYFLKENSTNI